MLCHAEEINICFYFFGSDLETDSGAASEDIKEIIRTEFSEDTHVFLMTGSSHFWALNLGNDGCITWSTVKNGELTVLEKWEDERIGESSTLCRYLKCCQSASPADNTVLIIWGHGTDGTAGIGYDMLNDSDTLTLKEIRGALDMAKIHPAIIGFDACAMASFESCWLLSDSCDYLVADTEPEEITGWPHHRWLSLASANTLELAQAMVDCANEINLRIGKPASMRMLELRRFRERYYDIMCELFANCVAPDGQVLVTQIPGETAAQQDALLTLLDGGDFLLGKYVKGNERQALELETIGDLYFNWLTNGCYS